MVETVAAATIVAGCSHLKVSVTSFGGAADATPRGIDVPRRARKPGGVPDDRRRRINRFN
ncbi:hypothetical protein [Burkholderia contaminans]|uniref:hypothetical protein n=1 Tax=Burkholderia contaminans TaxID=488447 RepID=UPI0015824B70|nr:hypothetical protein [Burkholderia contaminans]